MISKCSRVSRDFGTIGPQFEAPLIVLKHVIFLHRADAKKNKLSFYYEYDLPSNYQPFEKTTNINFRLTIEYIQIESRLHKIDIKEYSVFINSKIHYKDFIETKRGLEEVEKWFLIKDLYRIDDKNKIIDVAQKYEELNYVVFFKGKFETRYLAFKPCVVYDNEITYPGIQLSNEQGIIAQITYDEYLTLKLSLEDYMSNFQTNSMLLLNMAYNHLNNKNKGDN